MQKVKSPMLGKKVIVRAEVAGVHAGIITRYKPKTCEVTLSNARRLWRVYTRDQSGSLSDIAANGLKPNGGHSIGALLSEVTIINPRGLELDVATDEAFQSILDWKTT